jgi:hypothetical protein
LGVQHGDSGGGYEVGSFRCRLARLRVVCGGVSGVVGRGGSRRVLGCWGRRIRVPAAGQVAGAAGQVAGSPETGTGRAAGKARVTVTGTVAGQGSSIDTATGRPAGHSEVWWMGTGLGQGTI